MSDIDINNFAFGVGVEQSEEITESGVEVRVYSRTTEGHLNCCEWVALTSFQRQG